MSTTWSDTFLLMALGMGTVFIFLVLLIIAVTIMSKVIKQLSPEPVTPDASADIDQEIAAVAAIAYQRHQKALSTHS